MSSDRTEIWERTDGRSQGFDRDRRERSIESLRLLDLRWKRVGAGGHRLRIHFFSSVFFPLVNLFLPKIAEIITKGVEKSILRSGTLSVKTKNVMASSRYPKI